MAEMAEDVERAAGAASDRGGWLVEHRWEMDRGESCWLEVALQAFLDRHHQPVDESSRGDSGPGTADPGAGGPVDESSRADSQADAGRHRERSRRADAFMDLTRTALAHADDGAAVGDDRYLVHVIVGPDGAELVDGTPLATGAAERIACDTSIVTHRTRPTGEPLSLGRKTRVWSMAQRRAVQVRDGGHCRFPGCERRIADLHHQRPWAQGGPTDIDNGFLACGHHHTLLHAGCTATGNPNTELTFHRPDHTTLGTSRPRQRTRAMIGIPRHT
ncbi:MAG: HNH endonuclease [Actinomycetota bacterium]|nr:HNH endonuclease [Actinomycetota bacterium]